MIIFIFFLTWVATFIVLTFFSGLTFWFAFLWFFLSFIAGYLAVALIIIITIPFVVGTKETNRFKHYYLVSLSDFVRLFVLRLHITEIIGKENIPLDTNFGAYGNHRSAGDALVMLSVLRVPLSFMAKDSLFKNKLVSKWLKGFGVLEINRENARQALKEINKGTKLMQAGLSMLVFPEGTRKKEDFHNLDSFKPGAFKITTKAKLPILPFALIGAEKFSNQVIKKRTGVKVVIGKPIYYQEYGKLSSVELKDKVAGKIMLMLKENESF